MIGRVLGALAILFLMLRVMGGVSGGVALIFIALYFGWVLFTISRKAAKR